MGRKPRVTNMILSPDYALSETFAVLHYRTRASIKEFGEALNITSPVASKKLKGKVTWSLEDIYRASQFFSVSVDEVMPTRDEQGRYIPAVLPIEAGRVKNRTDNANQARLEGVEPPTF